MLHIAGEIHWDDSNGRQTHMSYVGMHSLYKTYILISSVTDRPNTFLIFLLFGKQICMT
jgi:hypothetical protein